MSKIKQLTQAIRNHAECELDYGTVRTLKMIDEEADRLEKQLQNTPSNSDYAKCLNELKEAVKWNGWGDKYTDNLIDILKKHFA